jgi:hypothetical protein
MNSEERDDYPYGAETDDANVLARLKRIDDQLVEELPEDDRIESGVPRDQRQPDVDFIQMTGLTRPLADSPIPGYSDTPEAEDLKPLSFYEKGIADVDSDMVPGLFEDESRADEEIPTESWKSSPISHLQDIIEELTRRSDEPREQPDQVETPGVVEEDALAFEHEPEVTSELELLQEILEPVPHSPEPPSEDAVLVGDEADDLSPATIPDEETTDVFTEVEDRGPTMTPEPVLEEMESGPIPSVCPESLEEDVTEPSPEAAATHEAPATVAEATGSAPPPHMIEAASLLQELQDQPREGNDIGGAEDTEADDLASAVQAEDRPQAPDEVAAAVSEHVFPAHTPRMVPYSGGDADERAHGHSGQR